MHAAVPWAYPSPIRALRRARGAIVLAAWPAVLVATAGCAAWATAATGAETGDRERVRDLIDQLGSDDYARREAASLGLAALGRESLGPLEAAMAGEDFEVASRAAEIVRGFLAAGQDQRPQTDGAADGAATAPDGDELAVAAEQVLCRVAERADDPLAGFAIAALDFHHRGLSQESMSRLEELGVRFTDDFNPLTGHRGLSVAITRAWQGTGDDLRLLPRVRNVVQVSVRGVRLEDAAAATLARIRGVERFELYGTGIGDNAVELLRGRFPEARIDVRKGGKLGIGGQPNIGPCMITQVVAGSAADKAGLQISDVVLAIDGHEVGSFEALTDRIGKHGPGDTLVLDVKRSLPGGRAEQFTTRVVLDGWD